MGKILLVDFDNVGKVKCGADDFIYYSTKNLTLLRKLKIEGKTGKSITGVFESELNISIKENVDCIHVKGRLNDNFIKELNAQPSVSEIIVDDCEKDYFIPHFEKVEDTRFVRDFSKMTLNDGSMSFTISNPTWNNSGILQRMNAYSPGMMIILSYASSAEDIPSTPLIVPKIDNIKFICIVDAAEVDVKAPWQKVDCSAMMEDIKTLGSAGLRKKYVMFNYRRLLESGKWEDAEDFEDYMECSSTNLVLVCWIDNSVKIVGDLTKIIHDNMHNALCDFQMILNPSGKSIMETLDECPEKVKNQFLKTLSGGSNIMFKDDVNNKIPCFYNIWNILRDSPCLSDKFMFLVFDMQHLWKACLRFPEIPSEIIISIYHFMAHKEISLMIPAQIFRGVLTI